jgi:hypothetical protein
MRCITKTDLVDIMVIKEGTDGHLHTASVEGVVRKAGNNLKHQAEENPDAPLAQIIHMGVRGVQKEILRNLPERKKYKENANKN